MVQMLTTKYILFAACFFFGCVVSICKHVRCQIEEVVFFYLQRFELSRPP